MGRTSREWAEGGEAEANNVRMRKIGMYTFFFSFVTLVTGPRRSLSLKVRSVHPVPLLVL